MNVLSAASKVQFFANQLRMCRSLREARDLSYYLDNLAYAIGYKEFPPEGQAIETMQDYELVAFHLDDVKGRKHVTMMFALPAEGWEQLQESSEWHAFNEYFETRLGRTVKS